jgi:hypothetical protein
MSMAASTHEVLGTTVTMPVEVRTASAMTAMFSVPAAATQQMIDPSGLQVLEHRPRRAVVGLVYVRYVDGDLGPYDELGVAVFVRNHDDHTRATTWGNLRALIRGRAGVLIHRLPVNGEFTRAAGREIWGFPKENADFHTESAGGGQRVVLRQHGKLAVDLSVRRGIPVPGAARGASLRAYSHLDGVTRFTGWEMTPHGVRSRPGGVRLEVGDHPIGRELAGLGLPRCALFSTTISDVQMTFGDAEAL